MKISTLGATASPTLPQVLSQPGPAARTNLGPTASNGVSDGLNSGNRHSLIGGDLRIKGKDIQIIAEGDLQIDGQVVGEVFGNRVTIGKDAQVSGRIVANKIVVQGHFQGGELMGFEVILKDSSRVDADIHHRVLVVDQGAGFEGRARKLSDADALPTPNEDPKD